MGTRKNKEPHVTPQAADHMTVTTDHMPYHRHATVLAAKVNKFGSTGNRFFYGQTEGAEDVQKHLPLAFPTLFRVGHNKIM